MNDFENPRDTSHHLIFHAFPTIDGTGLNNKADDAGTRFQPLFRDGSSGGASSKSGSQVNHQNTQEELLEQTRRQGYQRGFDQGQQNACELIQNNLSPIINELVATLKQFDAHHQALTENCSANSLKLAFDIVVKISGTHPRLKLETLAEVQTIIHHAMQGAYRLNLQFSAQDLELLKELSACESDLVLEQYQGLSITADSALTSGAFNSAEANPKWDAIHDQVALSLDTVMENTSNPPR
jgi:hypothetical protein